MKKLMMAVLFAVGCFAANAEGDWRETCGKIVCLGGDTGLAGFVKRMAPDYMTGDFAEAERAVRKPFSSNRNGYYDKDLAWHGGYFNDVGAFVEGHEVLTLFGMPYGLGQFIMIPVCLILMYLAIVKGFEPLLLLPIGSAGVSAVPMAARVSNKVALEDDPTNFVLMQAMGPNVSGVIGSAVVAGILYTLCR